MALIPFASIAFLWFVGVIRDQIGDRADRFFSTIYFGRRIAFVGLLLVWAALIRAILATVAADPEWADTSSFAFAASIVDVLGGTGMLGMAGVFAFSAGTISLRTRVMPRWIVWLPYALAIVMLVGGGSLRTLRFASPCGCCWEGSCCFGARSRPTVTGASSGRSVTPGRPQLVPAS